jgi:hypothetical protein
MKTKGVYVNDVLVGEAVTWAAVYELLVKKGVNLVGKPDAAEGPSAFFLRDEVEKDQSKPGVAIDAMSAHSGVNERAKAIARGLGNAGRAGTGVQPDNGMLRFECLSGGYYWISFDGSQVLRGATISEAEELQPKFIEAMERAGR